MVLLDFCVCLNECLPRERNFRWQTVAVLRDAGGASHRADDAFPAIRADGSGDRAFSVESGVFLRHPELLVREQNGVDPFRDQARSVLVETRCVAIVGGVFRIFEPFDLRMGDQNDHHSALVTQFLKQVDDLAPVSQRMGISPAVAAVGFFDGTDTEFAADLVELIKRDSVLSEGMTVMGIPSSGGVQKSICIPLEYLNGWLFKVPASRYVGERRKTIELYQRECYRALYDYWHRGGAVNPRLDEAQASALVGRIAEAGDGRFSDEISILLKQICERLDASTKALDRAAGRIVYLENFQPQGIPGEISDVTGRPKDRYTRGYYTSNPRAKLLAALAMIPDLPWEKCNV